MDSVGRWLSFFFSKMTKSCVVYGCHNYAGKTDCAGLSFYRLPLKNKKLLRAWLLRMRTDSVRVNTNSRVCSAHFEGGRKSGLQDIPSLFPWTMQKPRKAPSVRCASSGNELPQQAGEVVLDASASTGCTRDDPHPAEPLPPDR